MTERCKKDIWDRVIWRHRQCLKNATKDGYCGVHHPDAVRQRKEREKTRQKAIDVRWVHQMFNERAGNRCRELGIQPEDIRK